MEHNPRVFLLSGNSSNPTILYMRLRFSPYHFTCISMNLFYYFIACSVLQDRSALSQPDYTKCFHTCFTSHTVWSHIDMQGATLICKGKHFQSCTHMASLKCGQESHHGLKKLPAQDAAPKSNLTKPAGDNISTGKFIVPGGLQCTACLCFMKTEPGCSQCYMIEGQQTRRVNENERGADWI